MPEKLAVVREPAGEVAAAFRAEPFDPEVQQVSLQNVQLGIDDPHDVSGLLREVSCAPDDAKDDERAKDHNDKGQPPASTGGKDRFECARTGMKERREQHAREDNEQAGSQMPKKEEAGGRCKQHEACREIVAPTGRRDAAVSDKADRTVRPGSVIEASRAAWSFRRDKLKMTAYPPAF